MTAVPSIRRDPVLIALALVAPAVLVMTVADPGGRVLGAAIWPALMLLCAEIRLPMTAGGHDVQVGASIGAATGHCGRSGAALLHEVDLAMYEQKAVRARTGPKA